MGGAGGRRRNRGPRKGSDLQMHVRLNFQEAVMGAKKDLHLRYQIHNKKKNTMEVKERDVTVDIPAGIDNGMNLRLTGQGAEGDPGAPRGNLIVQVLVENDQYFHRDGVDVHTECPISMTQAVLGGTVDVRTLTGIVEMKIPKGTQVDAKLMLRGKGIPHLHSEGRKGNHIVHLQIEIPKQVSKRQEELLREFDEEMKHSGGGIYGRLAKAAGSAFESIFGHKEDEKSSKNGDASKKEEDRGADEDEIDVDHKKQQTA
jgi:molecular chaperone DnaJ